MALIRERNGNHKWVTNLCWCVIFASVIITTSITAIDLNNRRNLIIFCISIWSLIIMCFRCCSCSCDNSVIPQTSIYSINSNSINSNNIYAADADLSYEIADVVVVPDSDADFYSATEIRGIDIEPDSNISAVEPDLCYEVVIAVLTP